MSNSAFARRFGVIAFGLMGLAAAPLHAAEFVVNSPADSADPNIGDGTCGIPSIGGSICSLRAAIQEANANATADTITFTTGGPINLTSSLPPITSAVDITGPEDGITVDCGGDPANRTAFVYTNAATDVTYVLSNLTISNCFTDAALGGAAVRFVEAGAGSTLNISNVTFNGNTASDGTGGAIRLGASNPTAAQASLAININGSTFTGNAADLGGGAIYSTARLTVSGDSSFSENNSGDNGPGGAIASVLGSAGTLNVSNSTFTGNVAGSGDAGTTNGGAIYALERLNTLVTEITDSSFTGNTAVHGGGLALGDGTAVVSNSTFSTNTVTGRGGAIYLGADDSSEGANDGNSAATLSNLTLSDNTAAAGGGVGAADENSSGALSMINTTVAGNAMNGIDLGTNQAVLLADPITNPFHKNLLAENTPANCAHTITHDDETNAGSHVSTDDSCGFTQGSDVENATVSLSTLGDHGGPTQTLRLLAGSDGIDAGAAIGTATDQRGAPTTDGDEDMDAIRDAGAYEFAGFSAIEFSMADFSEAENNTPAMVSARRFGNVAAEINANVSSADGTATAGDDYTAVVNETLTWAAGNADDQTFEVDLEDDGLEEDDETVILTLAQATGSEGVDIGTVNPATLTITDFEEGEFNLQDATLTVTEGTDTVATIVITRTGGVDGASEVRVFTTDGGTDDDNAVAGEDYTAVDEIVMFADGQASATVEITITDDMLYEQEPESFTVTLEATGNTTPASVGDNTTTNVSIISDDPAQTGTFSFAETAQTVAEEDEATPVVFQVQRVGGDNCQVDVTYTVNAGTADTGEFSDAGTGSLSFAAGNSNSQPITVNVVDDDEHEGTEDFTIVLTDATTVDCLEGSSATIGDDDTATVSMTSNEKEQFSFSAATYAGSEGSGVAVITIQPVGEISGADVTVAYATADGMGASGATSPADYTAAMGELTWADGESDARDVMITINADELSEGDETFTVALTAVTTETTEVVDPTDPTMVVDPSVAAITITDLSGVRIVAAEYASDGESGNITVEVERFGSLDPNGAQVDLAPLESDPQSAEAGVDFVATVRTITWGSEAEPTIKSVNIPIQPDAEIEGDETFRVVLQGAINLAIQDPSEATLTIVDDDTGFRFSAADYSAAEADGTVTLMVERLGVTSTAATVDFATVDGTATAPANYTAQSDMLEWAEGNGDPMPIVITIIDNEDVNLDRNFTVELSAPTPVGNSALAEPQVATVTIEDDEDKLAFGAPTYSVTEGTATVAVEVERRGSGNGAVGVTVSTADDSAVAGSDYTATTTTLTWADGDTSTMTVNVPITDDDSIEEDPETFTLSLSNVTGDIILGEPSTTTVTINDNDVANLVIAETGGNTAITEGGNSDSLSVALSSQPTGAVTVTVTPPDRVSANPVTLAFNAANWNVPQSVTLQIADDEVEQENRTRTAVIRSSSAADSNYEGLETTLTITITDAGAPPTPPAQPRGGSSGSLGIPLLALLGLAAWRRRRQ